MVYFREGNCPNWCLRCVLAEKTDCASQGHSFINMTANTIKNLDARLLTFIEGLAELLNIKDRGTSELDKAILSRKQVQEQLSLILESIKAAENEIMKRQDENNLHLTKMISILERKSFSSLQTEFFLSARRKGKHGLHQTDGISGRCKPR